MDVYAVPRVIHRREDVAFSRSPVSTFPSCTVVPAPVVETVRHSEERTAGGVMGHAKLIVKALRESRARRRDRAMAFQVDPGRCRCDHTRKPPGGRLKAYL